MTTADEDASAAVNFRAGINLLPPELWRLIVKYLSKEDTRSCLSVCTLFHGLALPTLFSHITVRFGLWRAHDRSVDETEPAADDSLRPLRAEEVAELKRTQLSTCEMLLHILRTPSFARGVKKLSVRAYGLPGEAQGIFESCVLKEAILAMSNIRSFRWEGRRPLPAAFVLDALAQSSGHVLRELSIPSTTVTLPHLAKFKRLEGVTLYRPPSECDGVRFFDGPQVLIADALERSESTSTRLTLYGDGIWRFPLGALLRLRELELIMLVGLGGFERVLGECTELRSVTLDLTRNHSGHFIRMLEEHSAALPNLTALKLLGIDVDHSEALVLAHFLRDKKALRMLDLDWATDDNDGAGGVEIPEGGMPLPLLEVLPELPALDVLGLTLSRRGEGMCPANVRFLAQYVPLRVSALMLRLRDDSFFEAAGSPGEWANLVAKLTSLRYLHVFNRVQYEILEQRLLECGLPRSLELFGYGSRVRGVERESAEETSRLQESTPWSLAKVRFCSEDDFGCADWEWLFRYHRLDALVSEVRHPYTGPWDDESFMEMLGSSAP